MVFEWSGRHLRLTVGSSPPSVTAYMEAMGTRKRAWLGRGQNTGLHNYFTKKVDLGDGQ